MFKRKPSKNEKQQGNIVIGVIFVLAILSVIWVLYYKHQAWINKQNQAKSLGNQFSMVVNALENRLSFDASFGKGTYSINALINQSCGGTADEDYLPCGFKLNSLLLHGNFNIEVSEKSSDHAIRTAIVTLGQIGISNQGKIDLKPYLANLVTSAAKATETFSGNKYLSSVVSYDVDNKTSTVIAKVVANQNNSNIYLKVDGSNKMQNALSFNQDLNANQRMIQYVSEITNNGDLSINGNRVLVHSNGETSITGGNVTITSTGATNITGSVVNLGQNTSGSVSMYDPKIGKYNDTLSGIISRLHLVTKPGCYWTGNSAGHDTRQYVCKDGYGVHGIQFLGHRDHESSYIFECCPQGVSI